MYIFVAILLVSLFLYIYGNSLRSRFFAWFCNRFNKNKDPKYEAMKVDLFKTINSQVSHFPDLRKEKAIKVLEVGVGSGANFQYYPSKTRLTVVDRNPHFKSYYDANRSKFPNIHSGDIIVAAGEEMDFVESNSIDVVVVTLVLCSVKDVNKVLQHIYRVLAPGGVFYFLEHVLEWDDKKHPYRLLLHKFLTNWGIWSCLFDGCCLDRDPSSLIKKAGFKIVEAEHVYAPIDHFIFQIIKPHYIGCAKK